jgi:cytochrome c oxidase subunit III
MQNFQNTEQEQEASQYGFSIHPYMIIMALMLFGITTLFLSCSVAYIYTRIEHGASPLKLPWIFIFNTLLLIAGSIWMRQAQQAYKNDNTEKYKKSLLITIFFTLIFLIAQIFAWKSLFDNNVTLLSGNSAAYLYLISGLHFLHVIAGLPFILYFYIKARMHMVEPVSVLVYFSDPQKRMNLKLLTWYWHFLDILWIYLVLFFFVNSQIGA